MRKLIWSIIIFSSLLSQAHAQLVYAPMQPQMLQIPAILNKIAECESGNKQFNNNGITLRGLENPSDYGKFQINSYYWGSKAKELGYNLNSEQGNTLMALYIYRNYGTQPWNASKNCWSR